MERRQQVQLTASGLSEYTEYYYYITVSDGRGGTVQSATQGPVRTLCSGASLTCNGPFEDYEDCEECNGTGHSSYLVLIWGGDLDPYGCPDCGDYNVYPRNYGCSICAGGETTATKLFSINYCQTCGYQSNDPYNMHHHDSPCKTCNGTGKGTKSYPINCIHGQSSTHKYCVHNLMEEHEDLIELWEYLERISKNIATRTDITINSNTQSVSGTTENGESYKIAVGDI